MKIISAIFLFFILNFAEDISVTGTVKTQGGAPVSGASINIKKYLSLKAQTDSQGKFHLTDIIIGISSKFSKSKSQKPFIKGNNLFLQTEFPNDYAQVDIYNSCGVKVISSFTRNLSVGKHSIPLKISQIAHGFYIIKLQTSQERHILKMIVAGDNEVFSNSFDPAGEPKILRENTFQTDIDSLFITARGFSRHCVGISSYLQKDVEIVLSPAEYKDGMVKIFAKKFNFLMGSYNGYYNEKPVHEVRFTHNFWMDTTEVTQKGYNSLMSGTYVGYTTPDWDTATGMGDNHPAYMMNWNDALLYCNALSIRDGLDPVYSYNSVIGTPGNGCNLYDLSINYTNNGYRLPTEAEWEYSCRSGVIGEYYWDDIPGATADDYGWYDSNSVNKVHEVAGKLPNAYGLYDMGGNVFEFCNDYYNEKYSGTTQVDPVGPVSDPSERRVIRGGSFKEDSEVMRSALRIYVYNDEAKVTQGFRVVLPVK